MRTEAEIRKRLAKHRRTLKKLFFSEEKAVLNGKMGEIEWVLEG